MSRLAVVTGASGGIGRATVEAFHSAGWQVAGIDVAPTGPPGVPYLQVDLGADGAKQIVTEFVASLDAVDAVVNNAGIQNTGLVADTSDEEWQRILDVNLRGARWVSAAALPHLQRARGSVVNVASVHALATTRGAAAYAASKAALLSLTRSLALEWAPEVRVNCVLPGAVDTPMLSDGLTRDGGPDEVEDQRTTLANQIPLGRIGRPSEIAQAVLFLADADRSGFVTGQSIVVDGGVLAGLGTL
jgi:NAD(P)-dependent dehydrogenase (short-subunit alcohol dehydrogenase family)